MGQDVNFDNGGEEFNIAIDTSGELEFLANDKNGAGNRRMVIRDGSNEVGFDGRVTVEDQVEIGGSGLFGSLQLKASDGVNTIFLGSTQTEATMAMGGGHNGALQLFDDDGRANILLAADTATLSLGSDGQDGDVTVMNSDGDVAIQLDGGINQVRLVHDGLTTIKLDGIAGFVTVGANGEDGTIDLLNSAGDVTIRLSGESGTIEFRDSNGNVVLTLP